MDVTASLSPLCDCPSCRPLNCHIKLSPKRLQRLHGFGEKTGVRISNALSTASLFDAYDSNFTSTVQNNEGFSTSRSYHPLSRRFSQLLFFAQCSEKSLFPWLRLFFFNSRQKHETAGGTCVSYVLSVSFGRTSCAFLEPSYGL